MDTNGNGQQHQSEMMAVDPQAVIDSLMQKVQQLTMENVMLQAAVNQLTRQEAPSESNHPS